MFISISLDYPLPMPSCQDFAGGWHWRSKLSDAVLCAATYTASGPNL